MLPWLGRRISGNSGAYTYLPATVQRFPSPSAFGQMLEEAGFMGILQKPLTLGILHLHEARKPAPEGLVDRPSDSL